MDEGIRERVQVFRIRVEELLKAHNGRLNFSGRNSELLSEIIDFQDKHKITTAQFSELLGISSFRIAYIRKKILFAKTVRKPVRMKRVKIVDAGFGLREVRLRTPSGFEILFSRMNEVIEFVRVFR